MMTETNKAGSWRRVTLHGVRLWVDTEAPFGGSALAPEHHVKDGELDFSQCFTGTSYAHALGNTPDAPIVRHGKPIGRFADLVDGWPEAPMPESTPRVGRWEPRYWLCECDETPNNIAESERCMFCGTLRPPLPATPAPSASEIPNNSSETPAPSANAMQVCICGHTAAQHIYHIGGCRPGFACPRGCEKFTPPSPRFLTDAQVVGKEPIAGVDDAYEAFRERVRWFYRNAPECQEARKHSFGRQADVAFTLAMNEALAALRAVPVEGDEPVCYQLRQRGQSGHWLRWESYDSESMRDGFLPRDAEYELRTLYAHPAPDAS